MVTPRDWLASLPVADKASCDGCGATDEPLYETACAWQAHCGLCAIQYRAWGQGETDLIATVVLAGLTWLHETSDGLSVHSVVDGAKLAGEMYEMKWKGR